MGVTEIVATAVTVVNANKITCSFDYGDKTDLGVMMPVILIKKNPAGLNLTETIFDY